MCAESSAAQSDDDPINLSPEERARFAAYLRQDAEQEARLVEFLADLPGGTNGAHIRTDCKIRRDVKRALAEEIELAADRRTEQAAAQGQEYDSVTEDAIKHGAAIPPVHLPQDQRRAYLGGWFTAESGGLPNTPYTDPGCVDAWHAGFKRAKRESRV